jgi:hypothetical protein
MSVIERAVVSGMQALKILDIFGSDVQALVLRIPDVKHLWRELCGRVKYRAMCKTERGVVGGCGRGSPTPASDDLSLHTINDGYM